VTPLLTVRDLTTTFATADGAVARAVDGVSLELERGEMLALVGESGCGKSTLALSLLRLIPEPPGWIDPAARVELDGTDVLQLDGEALRRVRGGGIAFVFQEPGASLNPVLFVGTQVAETVRAHRPLGRRAARMRARELLAAVGLSDPDRRLDQYPHELSGGMQQRVMIAIALAGEPRVLIADEPTTALDVTIQAQILQLLGDLKRRLGLAILFITHDLGVAAGLADRIAVMYAGRIVETGPARELLTQPLHPYTEALLAAVPRLDRPVVRLRVIPGQPPPATRWPAGCRFHPRCPHAWERCRAAEPELVPAGTARAARCWLLAEPGRRAP
jgi:oligopeptide/dipeptide ABC transporter ATP-binding protein